jgi:ubiquinone biosynthesis protein Coq4
MGQRARPLFAQRWEEGWEKPLAQWRQELNLLPVQNLSAVSTSGQVETAQP